MTHMLRLLATEVILCCVFVWQFETVGFLGRLSWDVGDALLYLRCILVDYIGSCKSGQTVGSDLESFESASAVFAFGSVNTVGPEPQ